VSTILKFIYYGTPCNVKKIQTGDLLRVSLQNRCLQNVRYLAKKPNITQLPIYNKIIRSKSGSQKPGIIAGDHSLKQPGFQYIYAIFTKVQKG